MRSNVRTLIALVLALVVSACAGLGGVTPETPRERLLTAEATYEFVLDEVRSLTLAGKIEPGSETASTIAIFLVEARAALDTWQADPENIRIETLAQTSLQRLLALVNQLAAEADRESYWLPGLERQGVTA